MESSTERKKKDAAVERLLNADKKKSANPKTDPGKQYRTGFIDKIPSWILALFVKWWFAGAVCFFIMWGLGLMITDMVDMVVVLGVVLGLVTEMMVNNVFRFFATYEGQNDRYMMFPQKKYWTFLANIPYACLVLAVVIYIYNTINVVGNSLLGTEHQIILGVEPILFGLFYLAVDTLFITMKKTMISIIHDAKEKNGQ